MKSTETVIAEQNVDASIAQFESAVNQLIDKVEGTSMVVNDAIDSAKETFEHAVEKYESVKETMRQPAIIAKDIAERAKYLAEDVTERVRRNPEPFISWAALAVGLFFCYRAIRNHQRAQISNRHSWSQQEP